MRVKIDSKGRLYLKGRLREKVGNEAYAIELGNMVLIVPKPMNPIEELGRVGSKLPELSIEELKEEIAREAKREVG